MNSKITKFAILSILLLPLVGLAQEVYEPLVGIPGVDDTTDINSYINALYALSISIAALLAVIKIIIAGVKWMLTDIVTDKSEAKKDIYNATVGLIIVIAAVLILGVINTQLTQTSVFVDKLEPAEAEDLGGGYNPKTDSVNVVPNNATEQNRCTNHPDYDGTYLAGQGPNGQSLCIVTPESRHPSNVKDEYRCTPNNVVGEQGLVVEYDCSAAESRCEADQGLPGPFYALEHNGQCQLIPTKMACAPEKILCDKANGGSGDYDCDPQVAACGAGGGVANQGVVECNPPPETPPADRQCAVE